MTDAELEELSKRYRKLDCMEELSKCAHGFHGGYINQKWADYFRWLCYSAHKELMSYRNENLARRNWNEVDC